MKPEIRRATRPIRNQEIIVIPFEDGIDERETRHEVREVVEVTTAKKRHRHGTGQLSSALTENREYEEFESEPAVTEEQKDSRNSLAENTVRACKETRKLCRKIDSKIRELESKEEVQRGRIVDRKEIYIQVLQEAFETTEHLILLIFYIVLLVHNLFISRNQGKPSLNGMSTGRTPSTGSTDSTNMPPAGANNNPGGRVPGTPQGIPYPGYSPYASMYPPSVLLFFKGANAMDFLDMLEDEFIVTGEGTNDEGKKMGFIRRCDLNIRSQIKKWKEWTDGTWEDFKKALLREFRDQDMRQQQLTVEYLIAFKDKYRTESDNLRVYSKEF